MPNERDIPTKKYDHPPYRGHTPGPWISEAGDRWVREEATGATIARICEDQGDLDQTPREPREMNANGRLLAAAPELLDTLSAILKETDQTDRSRASLEYIGRIARAAIAKAEGKAGDR